MLAGALMPLWGQNPYLSFTPNPVQLEAEAGTSSPVSAKVKLTNTGNPVAFTALTNQGWLSVSPVSGNIGTGVTIELTVTGNPAQMQKDSTQGL